MKPVINVITKLLNHQIAWLCGFFVGIIIVFPTVISVYHLGFENFKGVYPTFNDDEIHYLAMAGEASEGHTGKGNVFLSEHKNNPAVSYGLAENIFGAVSRVFNIPVPLIFAVNDFLLPVIGFMMLYFLFSAITKNKNMALIFSASFYAVFLSSFGRPINPQFSFIFLAGGILLIWKIFENFERNIPGTRFAALLGADIGFLVYIYPYYWTALFALYGLLSFFLFVKTKKFEIVKNALIMLGVLAISIIPYAMNFLKASANPFYNETLLRYGMLSNHFTATYVNVALLMLAGIIVFLKRTDLQEPQRFFAFALPLTGVLLNWQNVITGKYLQYSSHYFQVTILFVFLTLALVFTPEKTSQEKSKKINYKNFSAHAIAVFLIVFIFYHQSGEFVRGLQAKTSTTEMAELQSYRPIFDWLNTNTKKDSVILDLDEKIWWYLPIYTSNNLYSYGYAGYYLASDDELEDRWVRQNIFNNVDADFITAQYKSIWSNKFIDKYQNQSMRNKVVGKLLGRSLPEPVLVPEASVERVLAKFTEVKKENLETALKKYNIDYILLDRKLEETKRIEEEITKEKFAEPVKEFDNIVIYKVRN